MSVQHRRNYDPDFKRNAVKLTEESGRSVSEVAENLGIWKAPDSDAALKILLRSDSQTPAVRRAALKAAAQTHFPATWPAVISVAFVIAARAIMTLVRNKGIPMRNALKRMPSKSKQEKNAAYS